MFCWIFWRNYNYTGDPLHSRAFAHGRAPLLTQPCPHCSHRHALGEQWARLCVFTLQGCVLAARLCRGSPVNYVFAFHIIPPHWCGTGSWNPSSWKSKTCVSFIVNTLRLRQNRYHFADVFICIFLNENIWISIDLFHNNFSPSG